MGRSNGLIYSFLPFFHIDWAAHLGGLAGGFLVGLVAGLPGLPNTPKEQVWKVAAGLAVAVTILRLLSRILFFSGVCGTTHSINR